jgi:hypothetical protein
MLVNDASTRRPGLPTSPAKRLAELLPWNWARERQQEAAA